jgi:hypothetical protein
LVVFFATLPFPVRIPPRHARYLAGASGSPGRRALASVRFGCSPPRRACCDGQADVHLSDAAVGAGGRRAASAQNADSSRTASAIIATAISEIVSAIKPHALGFTFETGTAVTSGFMPAAVDNRTLPTAAKRSANGRAPLIPNCSCEPGAPLAVDYRLTALRPSRNGDQAPSPPSSSNGSRITKGACRFPQLLPRAAGPPPTLSDGLAPAGHDRHLPAAFLLWSQVRRGSDG